MNIYIYIYIYIYIRCVKCLYKDLILFNYLVMSCFQYTYCNCTFTVLFFSMCNAYGIYGIYIFTVFIHMYAEVLPGF